MEKQTTVDNFSFTGRKRRGRKKVFAKDIEIVKKVFNVICTHFNISEMQLLGQRRFTKTAKARKFAMYLIYENTGFNCSEVATLFRKDHTTILAAVKSVRGYKQVKDNYVKQLDYIEQNFFTN